MPNKAEGVLLMAWIEQWGAISARIDGLVNAGKLHFVGMKIQPEKQHATVEKAILEDLRFLLFEIEKFYLDHQLSIPFMAGMALKNFLEQKWEEKADVLVRNMAPFEILRAQFNFYIQDKEIQIRSQTELAFEHLRRLIVVSADQKSNWQTAFKKGEVRCEQVGAVHLLLHGIWAFKVSSSGGATDLVFQEPLCESLREKAQRTARGLVLTEWKRVLDKGDVAGKAAEARTQSKLYKSGVLGGVELTKTRYVVLVTQGEYSPPADVDEDGIRYRHIVIPVAPKDPSKTARMQI